MKLRYISQLNSLVKIRGKEKIILLALWDIQNSNNPSKSFRISTERLQDITEIELHTISYTIKRLEKKRFIRILTFTVGRNSQREIIIPKDIFKELKNLKYETLNPELSMDPKRRRLSLYVRDKSTDKTLNVNKQKESSFMRGGTILAREVESKLDSVEDLSTDELFDLIDISPLKEIGLLPKHIKHFKLQKCIDPASLEISIDHFAFKIENKLPPFHDSPLGYFWKVTKNGDTIPMPKGYINSALENKKNSLSKVKGIRDELSRIGSEIFDCSFSIWIDKASRDEIKEIIPDMDFMRSSKLQLKILKSHFIETIWPMMKKSLQER